MKLTKKDKLEVVNGCLRVNGLPFVVEYPDEPMREIKDGKLVTRIGNHYPVRNIKGYFA